MRRVLHLADNPYTGGIPTHILSVCDAFANRDDVEIVIGVLPGKTDDTFLLDIAKERGIKINLFPMAHTFDVIALRAIAAFIERHEIDIVHVHDYRAHIITQWAKLDVPIVATSHGPALAPTLRTRLWQFFHLRYMQQRPAVVAVSGHVARWLRSKGISESRVHVIHNAVEAPASDGAIARTEFGAKDHDTVFMYAGRLVPGKGLERIIDAASTMDDAVVVFVGDGPLRMALEARAESANVRVHFAGYQNDPWPYYRTADCVVVTSEMEALPMTLIEAASLGIPAIATNVGGVPEVVEDEVSGLLVPPRDEEALAQAFDRMTDSTRRARYAAGAKQIYDQRFAPNRMADALAEVYSGLG